MGNRVTQVIYQCNLCDKTPDDGEHLWRMGREIWCEKCCTEQEEIANQESLKENSYDNRNTTRKAG